MSTIEAHDLPIGEDLGDSWERDLDGEDYADARVWDGRAVLPDGFHDVGDGGGLVGTDEFDGMSRTELVDVLARRVRSDRWDCSRRAKDSQREFAHTKAAFMHAAAQRFRSTYGRRLDRAVELWQATGEELPREFQAAQRRRHGRRVAAEIRAAFEAELDRIGVVTAA